MRFVVGGLAVALIFASSAKAGLVESFAASVTACNQSGSPCVSESSTLDPNLSVMSPDGSAFAHSSGYDLVNYGSLSLEAGAGGCCTRADGGSIHWTVGFTDSVTIFGGAGSGQLTYTLNEQASFGGNGPATSTDEASFSSDVPTTFTLGQPFTIGLSVTVVGSGIFHDTGGARVNNYSFASISVFDAAGNLVTGYSYVDDSYTSYPFVGGSLAPGDIPPVAPEPSSMLLGAMGLILLSICRLWRIRTPTTDRKSVRCLSRWGRFPSRQQNQSTRHTHPRLPLVDS